LILLLELFRKGNLLLDHSLIESKRTVKLFLDTLKSNLDEKWSLEKMADYCLLGTTRFTHYCEEIINCSPIEYLNLLRLNEASSLLSNTPEISMTEVAYRCGFSSPQYFNFAFKKHFGMSPLAFRKQQQKQD
jgi:AraC family L-rhamnose operon regulatory protein RhaS